MNRGILYTIAVDENGNSTHIDNAEKGTKYYCSNPICKKKFILRKSGKTGKGAKRPHFAHNELTPNCTPEGVLHSSFKEMLVELLKKYKEEKKPFIFNWVCASCSCKNSGNLLEYTASIKKEHDLGTCRPDIALLDKEENVLAVIEIVVTHPAEEAVLQYYKDKKIVLIQINLTSDEDLINVEEKAKNPNGVDLCISHKCQSHARFKIFRKIIGVQSHCGYFHPTIKFRIEIDSVFGRQTSYDFTDAEINKVQSDFNNNIKIENNKSTKEKCPTWICLDCQRITTRYNRRGHL